MHFVLTDFFEFFSEIYDADSYMQTNNTLVATWASQQPTAIFTLTVTPQGPPERSSISRIDWSESAYNGPTLMATRVSQ